MSGTSGIRQPAARTQPGGDGARRQRSHALLLRLYPPAWRDRYGDEYLALLADLRLSPIDLLDIALGALDARFAPQQVARNTGGSDYDDGIAIGGLRMTLNRLRASAITVFCAYIGFVVAGLAFNGILDDNPLTQLRTSHPALHDAVLVIQGGAVVALLAVLIGGLPIGWAALRQAQRERRMRTLLLFAAPPLALLALIVYAAVFVVLALQQSKPLYGGAPTYLIALYIIGAVLFCLAAIVSAAAVAVAIVRSSVSERLYRFARIPAMVTTLAMVVMLAATIAWGLLANADDQQAFLHAPGLFQLPTVVVWAGVVAAMAVATVVAIVGLARGRGAQPDASPQSTVIAQPA